MIVYGKIRQFTCDSITVVYGAYRERLRPYTESVTVNLGLDVNQEMTMKNKIRKEFLEEIIAQSQCNDVVLR
jgi:hypothetical protein